MRLTHFGHSCLLADVDGTRLLFDPGVFSHGFEGITDLDAILITHQHPDHVDRDRVAALVEANPQAKLFADPQTAAELGWPAFGPGQVETIGTVQVTGGGGRHAVIHPDIPVIDNTVYLVGTPERAQLVHPGDSLFVPSVPVDVLAIPAVAPWMKISETVDYLRAVRPRLAVPIHQAIASDAGAAIYTARLSEMSPAETEFRPLSPETEHEI